MKRILSVILLICMTLLISCDTEKEPAIIKKNPTYRGAYKSDLTELMDADTGDTNTVSSVRSYQKVLVEYPEGYDMTYNASRPICYTDQYCYYYSDIPSRNQWGIVHGESVLLQYDHSGNLVNILSIPQQKERVVSVYPLSDGRFVFLTVHHLVDFQDIKLFLTDADGTVQNIYILPKLSAEDPNFIHHRTMNMHVTERDNGTFRILVNGVEGAYYFDEQLNLLSSVELPGEYSEIFYISDGIYQLGYRMPLVCEVDMNQGIFKRYERLPVPVEYNYDCVVKYGLDGNRYFEYDDTIYCEIDGQLTEVLCWINGPFCYGGYYYIVDASTCYFQNPGSEANQNFMILSVTETEVLTRRILTLVNVALPMSEWMAEAITRFNEENEDYYIQLIDYADEPESKFNELLLSGDIPDMMVSMYHLQFLETLEKGVFLDLMPFYGDALIECAKDAYTYNGTLPAIPLSMRLQTLVSADTVLSDTLSWDDLYAMEASLAAGEAIISNPYNVRNIFNQMLSEFYDYETQTATFDSEEFKRRVRFLEQLGTEYCSTGFGDMTKGFTVSDCYSVSSPVTNRRFAIAESLAAGQLKLLEVPIHDAEAYSALKVLFGDDGFTLCGYPTDQGGVMFRGNDVITVSALSENLGGCKAFLDYLLSDAMQTSEYLEQEGLPVTYSALNTVIDKHRYFYYSDTFQSSGKYILISARNSSAEYDPALVPEDGFVIEITDADKAVILDFFETCTARADTDSAISGILEEELSAYRSGVRSLEEAAKLIQSRVFIYLNE